MDIHNLNKFIGNRIKEIRIKKKMTQKELGEKIGVKHNTISSYENGTNQLDQETLFRLSIALECKVDDFFPSTEMDTSDNLERALTMSDNLNVKEINFLKELIEKTLSLDVEEREQFLKNIRFAVEFYNNTNKD